MVLRIAVSRLRICGLISKETAKQPEDGNFTFTQSKGQLDISLISLAIKDLCGLIFSSPTLLLYSPLYLQRTYACTFQDDHQRNIGTYRLVTRVVGPSFYSILLILV